MKILECFQASLQSVKSNKLRSFLTMLGIIIGISSVITIVSVSDGTKKYITGQFGSIGTNIVKLNLAASTEIRERDYFNLDDANLIKKKIPEAEYVMPDLGTMGMAKVDNKSKSVRISITNEDSKKVYNIKMIKGRYLNQHDIETRKHVAVLDELTAHKFYRSTDVIGEKLKVNTGDKNIDLTIVGICQDPSGNISQAFGNNMPGLMLIPVTIGDKLLSSTKIASISIVLSNMKEVEKVSNKIVKLMDNKHRVTGKYTVQKGFKELETINKVLNTITAVLGAIAAISLFVGGIGVMNIMLVSVTERTREIGIRKAIGAKTRDIKLQFLMESIILCVIGGTIGTIFGITFGKIAGSIINIDTPISLKVILIAFGFSSVVGIFFGLYPANKAAKLDPIDALRYE